MFTNWFVLAASILLVQAPTAPKQTPSSAQVIQTDTRAGLELWQTRAGRFWIPKPGHWVIPHLEWEQLDQRVYEYPEAHVKPGDVVLDCGAHIGFYTRVALRAGARLVVAVEPEVSNVAAFKRNFERELRSGTVRLVPKGVWGSSGKLSLQLSTSSNDSHSLMFNKESPGREAIEVVTIDNLVRELGINCVDFIKMDIEGAETQALQGARATLKRCRPRLAISSYHLKDDPANIAKIVWDTRADYRIGSKDVVNSTSGIVPKVLFFY